MEYIANNVRGMFMSNDIKIQKDDVVTIHALSRTVKGRVISAEYYGEQDGWYIELTDANVPGGYSYWKQGMDGGYIVTVDNKPSK
jgi:hypothetical protein